MIEGSPLTLIIHTIFFIKFENMFSAVKALKKQLLIAEMYERK